MTFVFPLVVVEDRLHGSALLNNGCNWCKARRWVVYNGCVSSEVVVASRCWSEVVIASRPEVATDLVSFYRDLCFSINAFDDNYHLGLVCRTSSRARKSSTSKTEAVSRPLVP